MIVAEPSSTAMAVTTAASVTMATLFTDIDGATLVGAVCGASLFVMSKTELAVFVRVIYLAISIFIGYQGGQPLLGHILKEPAISAFVFSACCINFVLQLMESMQKINVSTWFNPK